jgi:hypothetical protein
MNRDRRRAILATLALCAGAALSGCAATPAPGAAAIERISFQPAPGPFCGRCENTQFTVGADGEVQIETGYWAGRYRDWRRQRTVKHVTAEQFAEFKRRLAPYKPTQDLLQGEVGCRNYITDNGGAIVEWSDSAERRKRVFDFGCLDDRAMNDAVRGAPSALGL